VRALVPDHPARLHPDWVVGYGGQLFYNPGVPAARAFVEDAILDAVERYEVDGVHFDEATSVDRAHRESPPAPVRFENDPS
jgi:uncharacterized lipoprotein YddW (UPF0748 family)